MLFAKPFHLDYFSLGLAANGWRFISAAETELHADQSTTRYLAGKERARLDDTVANATLNGYVALGDRIDAFAKARLQQDAEHAPDAVLRHHRRHHPGGAVHLQADVASDPAPHA